MDPMVRGSDMGRAKLLIQGGDKAYRHLPDVGLHCAGAVHPVLVQLVQVLL